MTTRTPEVVEKMTSETVEALQELLQALRDSFKHLKQAAESIEDEDFATTFHQIAAERFDIGNKIGQHIIEADEQPVTEGTWLGSVRTFWTSMRAALNSGNTTVVLIEAERADDALVNRFRELLPSIAGNPLNDKLLEYYGTIKAGHDRVLALRNALQSK